MASTGDRVLLSRRFADEDQLAFARLSGDTNPLHVDHIEARRTLLGAPAVHGMHLVLLALQAFVREQSKGFAISAIRCRFPNPVLVGDPFELRIKSFDNGASAIEGYVESDLTLDMAVELHAPACDDKAPVPDLQPVTLDDRTLDELPGMAGSVQVGIDAVLAQSLFPTLVVKLGLPLVAELLTLTRLVGMRCPGRHSLFSQLNLNICKAHEPGELRFRVAATDERFKRVSILVEGARLSGKLIAFFRPPPQPQPSFVELSKLVRPDEFSDSAALVVGGSRGLGEITAKLLAAGGARVIISYHRGEQDAAHIAAEIKSAGGSCEYRALDVLDSGPAVRDIYGSGAAPRTIYYFATPLIFARRRGFFSLDLLQNFIDHYVIGFARLIEAAASQNETKLGVFCPSSVAVVENLRELAEYSMAKKMAEDLCAFYNRFSNIHCIVERLPRLRTDQTATLVDLPHEDNVQVMLPIVRRVEQGV
jgi:acyl dehydratase